MITKKIIFLPIKIRPGQFKGDPMIKNSFKVFLFGFIMVAMSLSGSSQTMEIGPFVGGSYYIGDLNPAFHFNQTQLSYGALARFNLHRRWAVRLSYYRGKVKGSDAQNQAVEGRDLNFVSKINDFSVVAEFNFWDYFTGSKKNYWTPYLFMGAGFFTFNPQSYSGEDLQPLGTEGQNIGFNGSKPYNKWGLSFPFGFGFKYSLSEKIGLGVEWGMRKTFTDYIDDVSTTYYLDGPEINPDNIAQVLSDPTMDHEPYMQRGNEGTMDWFNYFGLSVTYKINLRSKLKCNLEGW